MEKIVNLYFSIFVFALILVSLFTNANFWSFTLFFILVSAVDFGIGVVFISARKFLKETPGVSRSKYAAPITAPIPASWAASTAKSEGGDQRNNTGELAEGYLILPHHGSEFTHSDLLHPYSPSARAGAMDAFVNCDRTFIWYLLPQARRRPKSFKS